jgi:hypothetical protein
MEHCTAEGVRAVMMKLFKRYGVPGAIQCDNGKPFISTTSRGGLSSLSAWWVSLGIRIARSRLGSPQDNGAHERMHADLAADVEAAPAPSFASQQRACDRWRQIFNHVRPHEALGGRVPADVYRSSPMKLLVRPARYPAHFVVRRVAPAGCIKLGGETYFISGSLRGQDVGLEPLDGLRHRVWFYSLDLGELEVADVQPRHLSVAC